MRRVSWKKTASSARRGITIIEVMVVVTGAALLLGLCAVSIQLLMKLNADVQGRYGDAVALERLALQLRDDAHASQSADMMVDPKKAGQPAGLRLALEAEHFVVYDFGDGGVVRAESRAGKMVRHERFALARGATAKFEIRDEASRPLLALVVSRAAGKSQSEPPRPVEIVALQGKDHVLSPERKGSQPQ